MKNRLNFKGAVTGRGVAPPRFCVKEEYQTVRSGFARFKIWTFTYSDGTVETLNMLERVK